MKLLDTVRHMMAPARWERLRRVDAIGDAIHRSIAYDWATWHATVDSRIAKATTTDERVYWEECREAADEGPWRRLEIRARADRDGNPYLRRLLELRASGDSAGFDSLVAELAPYDGAADA